MGIKELAIAELDALMRDFGIKRSRLGRDLFNNPSFYYKLVEPDTRVIDIIFDKIFQYAVTLRGQQQMLLSVGKNESRNVE